MQIIGITGGSGAGKSEVCRILGERGIPIFDADRNMPALPLRILPAFAR